MSLNPNIMTLIPEDEPDSKPVKRSIFSRSITVKFIKSPYFPILLPILALFLCAGILYLHSWLTNVIYKEKVVTVVPIGVRVAKAAEKPVSQMTIEEYIAYKFGKDARMALAISQAENGTRQCDRMNWNTNKTVDFGVFMINTVHLKKGYSISDLTDCHTNIDIAYDLFKAQGWVPWVVYNTGAYKRYLN